MKKEGLIQPIIPLNALPKWVRILNALVEEARAGQ